MSEQQIPEQSDSARICTADAETLRGAQCDDAEIKAHLLMHTRGQCPTYGDNQVYEEYGRLVNGLRHRQPVMSHSYSPPFIQGTPGWDAEIRDIVDECERDPSYEHRVVEPLAGILWPQVKGAMNAERHRREVTR